MVHPWRCYLEQDEENGQESQELIPVEQQTLIFYGKPIIVVRLPDNRPAVVLRFLCENMGLETRAQIRRIRSTEAITDDLAYARVQTEGGPQKMAVLVLHGAAFWLATIDPKRVKEEEARTEVRRYQKEAVDMLYAWASTPRAIAAPTNVVPAEPITKPTAPAEDAPLEAWREYYQRMLALIDWQMDVERWRGGMESRMEGVEAMTDLIPEILDRLGPEKLTSPHRKKVRYYVKQLVEATGRTSGAIYNDFYEAFEVAQYQDVPEEEWPKVENWFQGQIERGRKK